ncbi:MAG: hypothetical protein H7Y38_09490 [Armatimonadetes bacterium]|nr:hypothetical protein [Armatimonadota bacterium]
MDTFTILSELKLFRRTRGDKVTAEDSYFEFNERILSNLLSGFTRPIYFETILRFKSEIAQILYTHLDLIMADKTRYERRTKELFAELGIDGVTYRYPSKRAQIPQLALKELQDVPVPTGLLGVTLERTVDDTDFKIVARKTRRASKTRKEETLSLFAPEVSESPPVVTQIINAPVDKAKRSVNKPIGDKSSGAPRNVVPSTDAPEGTDSVSTQADAQKKRDGHFYQIFFQTGETARPTPVNSLLLKRISHGLGWRSRAIWFSSPAAKQRPRTSTSQTTAVSPRMKDMLLMSTTPTRNYATIHFMSASVKTIASVISRITSRI